MLILTVPLIDTSLHKLTIELEGKIFATLKHNMHIALPDKENVHSIT